MISKYWRRRGVVMGSLLWTEVRGWLEGIIQRAGAWLGEETSPKGKRKVAEGVASSKGRPHGLRWCCSTRCLPSEGRKSCEKRLRKVLTGALGGGRIIAPAEKG